MTYGCAMRGHGDEGLRVRAGTEQDLDWIRSLLSERWGSPEVVTRGRLHRADRLPGFVALEGERPVGAVTYAIEDGDCEIVTLDSLVPGKGIGSALVQPVIGAARAEGCDRVWLITTNDNTGALCFYQKIGFELVALYRGAVKRSREIKPGIPEAGCDGIPIRDEIELEMRRKPHRMRRKVRRILVPRCGESQHVGESERETSTS